MTETNRDFQFHHNSHFSLLSRWLKDITLSHQINSTKELVEAWENKVSLNNEIKNKKKEEINIIDFIIHERKERPEKVSKMVIKNIKDYYEILK